MKTLNENQIERVNEFLNGLNVKNIDIPYFVNVENIDIENAFESIEEILSENNAFDVEIIYYSVAIDYLKENDPSLRESLNIAIDYGFELSGLSSEVLASLLASQNAREEWGELQSEIDEFFEDLCEELQEDEDEE